MMEASSAGNRGNDCSEIGAEVTQSFREVGRGDVMRARSAMPRHPST